MNTPRFTFCLCSCAAGFFFLLLSVFPLPAFSQIIIYFDYNTIPADAKVTSLRTDIARTQNTVCTIKASTNTNNKLELDISGGLCFLSGTVGFQVCFKVTTASGTKYFVTDYADSTKSQSFTLTPNYTNGELNFSGDLVVKSESSCPSWENGVPLQ